MPMGQSKAADFQTWCISQSHICPFYIEDEELMGNKLNTIAKIYNFKYQKL